MPEMPPTSPADEPRADSDEQLTQALRGLLSSLAEQPKSSALQVLTQFQKHLENGSIETALAQRNPEHFRLFALYPLESLIGALSDDVLGGHGPAKFLFTQYRFVETHFKEVFRRLEGNTCCADKSRWVTRALARHLLDGTPIHADFNQQYTFHLPSKVLNTQESILDFFEALRFLHAGQPERYLKALSAVHQVANPPVGEP